MIGKRSITRSQKALHPVTIAIFLIILLISVIGITYIWMNLQTRAGNSIQIQSVTFQPDTTTIYVQNTGQGTVTLKTAQIDNEQYIISNQNCIVNGEHTTTLPQGSTAQVNINKAYTTQVHIKVICQDGTAYEADYKPKT
ncbi:MAG: hypothetical protein QXZ70_04010 [Candidatus Bathyarchaeia archaeon]